MTGSLSLKLSHKEIQMDIESRKTTAFYYINLVEMANNLPYKISNVKLFLASVGLIETLKGTPHYEAFHHFRSAIIKSSGLLETQAALVALKEELKEMDEVWFYEPREENWHVFKVDHDGHEDTVGIVETEGLATLLISKCDNPECPAPSCDFTEPPEGYRIEEGSDDDWDLYRTAEGGDEEWFASLSTEHISVTFCHIVAGNL
jgi:hypothetical protein